MLTFEEAPAEGLRATPAEPGRGIPRRTGIPCTRLGASVGYFGPLHAAETAADVLLSVRHSCVGGGTSTVA